METSNEFAPESRKFAGSFQKTGSVPIEALPGFEGLGKGIDEEPQRGCFPKGKNDFKFRNLIKV